MAAELPVTRLLDQLYTPILLVDRDENVRHCNAACESLLGERGSHLRSRPLNDLPQLAALMPVVQRSRHSQRRHIARDIAIETVLGMRRVDVIASAIDDDILIELPAIDPLRGSRRSLERWQQAETLELMVQGLFHEIRNPLSGMRGAAQLLEQEIKTALPGSALAEYTRLIQQESDRIAGLMEQFSQGAQSLQCSAVNIHQVLDDAIALQQAAWDGRPQVAKDYDPSIPEIQAEQPLLTQIILNLLNNAAQANAAQIQVRTRIEHQCPLPRGSGMALAISVSDDGHGVPAHLRDVLFLPLVSGRPEGTGLGLALAQQIAHRHGGLLQHHDRDQGSLFTLLLPIPGDTE
ncbi:MAG: nitrogen regulation protein NR(II) [Wenzhouxiangellaceae bacterium]